MNDDVKDKSELPEEFEPYRDLFELLNERDGEYKLITALTERFKPEDVRHESLIGVKVWEQLGHIYFRNGFIIGRYQYSINYMIIC